MHRSFGSGHALASFRVRLKTETMQVVKSPGLIVLLLIAVMLTAVNLAFSQTLYGTASYPLTANVITTVIGGMSLFTLIVAVFYGGELVWRERDVKINEIIDAAPASSIPPSTNDQSPVRAPVPGQVIEVAPERSIEL